MEALKAEAKEVEDCIKIDVHEAANKLLQLTNEYTADVHLKKRALKLNWDLIGNSGENANESSQQIENEINDILHSVLTRLESNPDQVEGYRENLEKTREYFIKSSNKQDLVFLGKNLSYEYGQSDFTLTPYDIELYLGQITAVVGENSSGKSTLIKIVAGEHLAKSGELSYPLFSKQSGKKIDWRVVKEQIAYIPQQLERWSGVVKDYLQFNLAIKGIQGQANVDEVEYIIQRLGLKEFVDRSCNELSGGARMRVELAKALVWKPKLLILDEPLANLDINAQAIFLRDLEQLARSHKNPISVLITSQHLFEMENISDRTIFLKKGVSEDHSIGEVIYNDYTANFGNLRKQNSFEIGSKSSYEDLRSMLMKNGISDISSHGHYYVVNCSLDIDTNKMLEILVKSNIHINYFRDTSASTRTLFEKI